MTDDSIEIIKMLQDARLGWIADELVESIALGRQTTKEFRESGTARATKASSIEPFNRDEEMALIVETLAQYFIVVPEAWRVARLQFQKADTFTLIGFGEQQFSLSDQRVARELGFATKLGVKIDDKESFREFSSSYSNNVLPALSRILAKLWPHGVEDFNEKFFNEDTKPK